ncbi:MAG: L,D-transpeptidase family protein [Planctomycetota bacterium]
MISLFSSKSGSLDWLIRVELVVLAIGLCAVAWKVWFVSPSDAGDDPNQASQAAGETMKTSTESPASDTKGDRIPPNPRTLLPVDAADAPPLGSLSEPWVLVEKVGRRLTVYDGQRPVKRYRVDVGRAPGDKQREGDMKTPEGTFTICVHNRQSKFTRSLGLSYPNIEDARRGLRDGIISRQEHDRIVEAIRAGRRPPWNTALGGEIMIHGNSRDVPGKKWTAGCVGLIDNDHIRELFAALPPGTRVVIRP